MVLLYSTRLRRRAVTRPGPAEFLTVVSDTPGTLVSHAMTAVDSAAVSGATLRGGISPAASLFRTFCHTSGCASAVAGSVKGCRLTLPMRARSLWQPRHVLDSTGTTLFWNSSADAGCCACPSRIGAVKLPNTAAHAANPPGSRREIIVTSSER